MWRWLTCVVTGRHDYTLWCEPGRIFLRCLNCGWRSQGWETLPVPGGLRGPARAHVVPRVPERFLGPPADADHASAP